MDSVMGAVREPQAGIGGLGPRGHAPTAASPRTRQATQRGASLVELLVGVTVGLVVIAAALTLASMQVGEHRRLQLETQVLQDLRAAADVVTRELRRAGHWPEATLAIVTAETPPTPPTPNPHAAITPDTAAATQVDFSYVPPGGAGGPFGFKLEARVLKTRLGGAGWQELTDANVLRVTAFSVTPRHGAPIRLPCPALCADGTTACWPTLAVREFVIDVAGESAADPSVRRALRTVVRPRTDLVTVAAAGSPACPA